ncbi:tetratricopeptide repeat protein [Amycolatopsis sp. NBC_00345]|uniref:tetratricopeptide repeat protein n=1 Tax=Amycolatopsis sp. NBC_00345 TaxID=2975955 RepID=UPI002E266C8E
MRLVAGELATPDDDSTDLTGRLLGLLLRVGAALPLPLLAIAIHADPQATLDTGMSLVKQGLAQEHEGWFTATGHPRPADHSAVAASVAALAEQLRHDAEARLDAREDVSGQDSATSAGGDHRERGPASPSPLEETYRTVPSVAAALSACGDPGGAASLAYAWWPWSRYCHDPDWEQQLSQAGEAAAIAARAPHLLTDLLALSARAAYRRDDHQRAEAQWTRALAVSQEAADHKRIAALSVAMGEFFVARGRLHRALDVFYGALAAFQRLADPPQTARTLWRIGLVQLAADRAVAAITTLNNAEDAARAAGQRMPDTERADIQIALGRALWLTGTPGLARRAFSNALACLVDTDPQRADHVRAALRTPENAALPPQLGA